MDKNSTQKMGQFLADMINQAADKRARLQQKEARFRQSLGTQLHVPKKESEK